MPWRKPSDGSQKSLRSQGRSQAACRVCQYCERPAATQEWRAGKCTISSSQRRKHSKTLSSWDPGGNRDRSLHRHKGTSETVATTFAEMDHRKSRAPLPTVVSGSHVGRESTHRHHGANSAAAAVQPRHPGAGALTHRLPPHLPDPGSEFQKCMCRDLCQGWPGSWTREPQHALCCLTLAKRG